MLYLMTGASGTGKTASFSFLATPAPDVALHDYDTIGIPENAPAWRIDANRLWLDTTELVIEEATRQVAGWM